MTLWRRVALLACVLSLLTAIIAPVRADDGAEKRDDETVAASATAGDDEIPEHSALENVRFFKEVRAKGFSTVHHTLARLSRNGDFVLLVETDAERNPISDTLLVWVQHHGPEQPMAEQAAQADLIIACYPELASEAVQARHVLPEARGRVWTYFIKGRHLIVSDRRHPMLDFALKSL